LLGVSVVIHAQPVLDRNEAETPDIRSAKVERRRCGNDAVGWIRSNRGGDMASGASDGHRWFWRGMERACKAMGARFMKGSGATTEAMDGATSSRAGDDESSSCGASLANRHGAPGAGVQRARKDRLCATRWRRCSSDGLATKQPGGRGTAGTVGGVLGVELGHLGRASGLFPPRSRAVHAERRLVLITLVLPPLPCGCSVATVLGRCAAADSSLCSPARSPPCRFDAFSLPLSHAVLGLEPSLTVCVSTQPDVSASNSRWGEGPQSQVVVGVEWERCRTLGVVAGRIRRRVVLRDRSGGTGSDFSLLMRA